ncbi:MAG: metallophosphoesterase [Candidatus Buchananbacteria bacterium RIFCSPHIGHO2_02_FULL_40_13]|uniref:Metallophosphoesterase n=1 Tax=Candidatus Buchananbacteria bacterium RIFCSPLOWO2_01_FULL_39_33 TaxID=1797543 RepID=A0A1G1YH99_9BACT|nr:MAG: metallophosphoesterase [Candidatus Buchananbacteria bacterium RIFCSPHIGHO2_01_FULL_40_35]OGY49497.1 MAG: metallophosphoesterase [Candidatus Buchananbacteria bacterium RIFCSPHIGHO2_02_FULL_40_13]OGY51712.1 MAG: metallophosphoesterase [Candidatus Buchananbacteria bacterium RIFCSPLOWO2_01_FULL_39_33]
MLKIIFLADIVGKIGRRATVQYLPKLKKKYKPDLVFANAENIAHGIGFTEKTLNEVIEAGVDFFTSGNHAWSKAGSDKILNNRPPLVIRPANYQGKKSGVGFLEIKPAAGSPLAKKIGQNKIIVVNLLGRVFIPDKLNNPFKVLAKIIKKYKDQIIIVDFHAEATSEKNALAQYFDGQVAAILGTHTHVPTSDSKLLAKGTGFITDIGMIGYYDSVIGASKNQIFNLFLDRGQSSKKHDLPDYGYCQFNAVYLEIDPKTQKTVKIKRLDKIIKVKTN